MRPQWPSSAAWLEPREVGAMADASVLVQCDPEIDSFPRIAFDLREESRGRLCVMPDVRASAGATADAFPGPEPPVLKAVTGRGGEDRGVGHRAVEKPEGKRRVVPGFHPASRLSCQAFEVAGHVTGNPGRRVETRCIVMPDQLVTHAAAAEVREVPGDHKRELRLCSRRQAHCPADFTFQVRRQSTDRFRSVLFTRGTCTNAIRRSEQRQRHGAKVALGFEVSGIDRRRVGEDDVVHPDVAPRAGFVVDDLQFRLLAFVLGHVQRSR